MPDRIRPPGLPITLDSLDRDLLRLLEEDPGASFTELAARLDEPPRAVARRVERLQGSDVVRVLGRTLPGFDGRLVRLLRIEASPDPALALARLLATETQTSIVRLSRDTTELICGTVEPPSSGPDALLGRILSHAGVRHVDVQELLQVWGRHGGSAQPDHETDATDRAILRELADDGRMSSREVAARIGVNASTVSRRRQRLVDAGVLYLEADVHPLARAGSGDVMAWLGCRPGAIGPLGERLRALPQTQFVAATSGPTQLVVHVVVPRASDVVAFVDEHLAHPDVTSLRVVPMGLVLKRTNAAVSLRPAYVSAGR